MLKFWQKLNLVAVNENQLANQDPAAAPQATNAIGEQFDLVIGADGWCEVAKECETPLVLAPDRLIPGKKQIINRQDMQKLVANVELCAKDPDWDGIPIRVGHPKDGPSIAWAKQARINSQTGRLEVLPEWSEIGKRMIAVNKEYKRLSAAWDGEFDVAGNFHPIVFDHIGTTNKPNIKGLKPMVNTDGQADAGGAAPEPLPGKAVGPSRAHPVSSSEISADSAVANASANSADAGQAAPLSSPAVPSSVPSTPSSTSPVSSTSSSPAADAAALNSALAESVRLRDELAAERQAHNETIADLAIARKIVAESNRARALQILAENRAAAVECWFVLNARPAGPVLKSPPACPLDGARLAGGVPAPAVNAAAAACQADPMSVAKAVNAYIEAHPGTGYSAAHTAVWSQIESGKLNLAQG